MTMTHKEALDRAVLFWFEGNKGCVHDWHAEQMAGALRAYIEACGLVLAPREPTDLMVRYGDARRGSKQKYMSMLAAAPDPFAQEERA